MNILHRHQKKKTTSSDTSNKNSTQQKRLPLMPFENNGTFQKWHMTNTPPEIGKYDTQKKMVPYKNGTPCEKMLKGHLPRAELSDS